ncbi:hypothetical protein BGX21_009894 [Mortierella sp. AD011]|nr:hypothetical protein BGX20_000676 [Mortierella sp. AD010]KAF9403798.1 hypothetical protein BGX21_009894 [Mortierella sp. AD011]
MHSSFMTFKALTPILALLFASSSFVNAKSCSNTCPEEVQTVCGVSYNGRGEPTYKTFPGVCIMEFHNCIFNENFKAAPIPASFETGKYYSCETLGYHSEL